MKPHATSHFSLNFCSGLILQAAILVTLLIIPICPKAQTYERIIDLQGSPDAPITNIIELPNQDGFILLAEAGNGAIHVLRLDIDYIEEWSTCITYFSNALVRKNTRLAYNEAEDLVIVVGQEDGDDKPAYVLIEAANGSITAYKIIESNNGIIRSVKSGGDLGFFFAGTAVDGGKECGLVGRIDPVTPVNDWTKKISMDNADDDFLNYFDLAVDEEYNDLLVSGHLASPEPLETSVYGVQIDRFDADDGDVSATSIHWTPWSDEEYVPHHIVSLGNKTYLASTEYEYSNYNSIHMFYHGGESQWADFVLPNSEPVIHKVVYHPYGFIGVLVEAPEYSPFIGLLAFDMNGKKLWAKEYDVESVTDFIATQDGKFIITAYKDNKNLLLITDQFGKTGCEETVDIDIYSETGMTTKPGPREEDPLTFEASSGGTSACSTDVSNGECCWIEFEKFDSRHVWHCDTAFLEVASYDPSFDYQWYNADNDTALSPAETTHVLTVDPQELSIEYPYKSQRWLRVEDENGCKGEDVARFTIIETSGAIYQSSGIEDQYCGDGQYAPPLSLLAGHGYVAGNYGIYDYAQGGNHDLLEDMSQTDWNPYTTATTHIVYQRFDDPSTTGCIVDREYEYEVMSSCNCTQSAVNVGAVLPEGSSYRHYTITNLHQNLDVYRHKLTAIDPMDASVRYRVADNEGLPWLSEYWLQGFGVNDNWTLCLEVWYKNGGSDVCYYDKHCSTADVYARKRKTKSNEADSEDSEVSNTSPGISDITIMPNPSSGLFTVNGISEGSTVKLRDIQGNQIELLSLSQGNSLIDLSGKPSGMYLLHVMSPEGQSRVFKLLKSDR